MKFKFVVEQGGETKAEEKGDWFVIRVKDRLYRWRSGPPSIGACEEWWVAEAAGAPTGWESFPIWPGTDPEEIEVRARLKVDAHGDLVLLLNGKCAAPLTWRSNSQACAAPCIKNGIDERLAEIREGKP